MSEIGSALHKALSLIKMLHERKQISARDIAQRLEVSTATAHRYLKDLNDIFFIYNPKSDPDDKPPNDGIYKINPQFDHQTIRMPQRTADADFFLSMIDAKNGKKNSKPFIFIGDTISASVREAMRIIHDCIKSHEKCSFLYHSPKKPTNDRYVVEPYEFICTDNTLYLLGVHNGAERTFRLDRMDEVINTGEVFVFDEKIIRKYSEASTVWHVPNNAETVTIEVLPELAIYFKERRILPEQKIIEEFEDGSIKIEFKSSSVMEFQKLLLGWFGSFRKVTPKHYAEHIENMIERYKNRQD